MQRAFKKKPQKQNTTPPSVLTLLRSCNLPTQPLKMSQGFLKQEAESKIKHAEDISSFQVI